MDRYDPYTDKFIKAQPHTYRGVTLNDVMMYFDSLAGNEDAWTEFCSCFECRGWGLYHIQSATDKTDARQDFMDIVYSELESDTDNNRANRIIWAADGYAERRVDDALQVIEESVQLGTNLAEVGIREVIGYPIDADALMEKVAEEYGDRARDRLYQIIRYMPPAQPEPNYDEWCTDCKEYDHENSCCPRWTKVIRQTRRELQDEFVMTAVDGTLWVTVDDVQKVGRVIVDEDKSKFCRQFYLEEEQRTGKWIPQDHNKRVGNISTCVYYHPICSKCGKVGNDTYKYCPHCGAKMTEGANNETD